MSSSNPTNVSTTSEQPDDQEKDNDVHNVSDNDNGDNEDSSSTTGSTRRSTHNHHHRDDDEEEHKVQLAVYDLSRGMAKELSAQFLGPDHTIAAVPHTGVLVFGKEYFFGQSVGLAAEAPEHFRTTRGMAPLQILDVGTTTVSSSDFDNWCESMTNSSQCDFHATKYNLFDNNCNHYSQRAIREGLRIASGGVPQWILDVPQKVLASPMGPMLRPVLENMQVSGGVPFAPDTEPTTDGSDDDNEATEKKAEDLDSPPKDQETPQNDTTTKTKSLHPRQEDKDYPAATKATSRERDDTNSTLTGNYDQPPPLKSPKKITAITNNILS